MAAPSLRSSSSAASQTAATFAVTKPTGTVSGDLLLAFQSTFLSVGNVPGVPTNWTLVDRTLYDTDTCDLACYYLAAGGSEPASYTFNNSSGLSPVSNVWILCLSGAATGVERSSKNTGSGTTATATGVTTDQADEFLAAAFAVGANTGETITPNSLTDVGTIGGMSNELDVAYVTQAVAGASGNKTATLSGSLSWAAMLVAVRALAATGPAVGTMGLMGVGR